MNTLTHNTSQLTDEGLVVVDGGPDVPAPPPDDDGVVDVVVEALTDVEGLLPGRPQLQRYPYLSRYRLGTIIIYGTWVPHSMVARSKDFVDI